MSSDFDAGKYGRGYVQIAHGKFPAAGPRTCDARGRTPAEFCRGITMLLKIDFIHDHAEILRQRLDAAGYGRVAGETDEDSIARYLNVLNRRVEPRPRQTKMAAGFACPPDVTVGCRSCSEGARRAGI